MISIQDLTFLLALRFGLFALHGSSLPIRVQCCTVFDAVEAHRAITRITDYEHRMYLIIRDGVSHVSDYGQAVFRGCGTEMGDWR